MGSGNKGLYSGAYTGDSVSKHPKTTVYKATASLSNHIENPQPTSSNNEGIKGAHNRNNFQKEVERAGARSIAHQNNSQLDGVEKITYQMPKKGPLWKSYW